MPGSDETFLESFIEFVSTLPPEVRRNMELTKDLDKTYAESFEEMAWLQSEYVQRVQQTIGSLEVVNGTEVRVMGAGPDGPTLIPTTEELMRLVEEPATLARIQTIEEDLLQRAAEKVTIADQTLRMVDVVCKRLDSDIKHLEQSLHATGEFQAAGVGQANDLAAIQVTLGSPDWILAKVISFDSQTGMYKLSDEDTESNKTFTLPEPQVVILGSLKSLNRGDVVLAVYPDTTSFYQATVVQTPRKVAGGGSFVMVNFVDDSDEHGVTHDKAVLLTHVMKPPPGVPLHR